MYSSQQPKTHNRNDHNHQFRYQQQPQQQTQQTKQQHIVQIYDTANQLSDLLQTGLSPPACEAVIDLLRAGVEPDKVIAMVQQLQQQQQQRAAAAAADQLPSSPSNQSKFLRRAMELHKKQSDKESQSSQAATRAASKSVGW
jgi:Mitotic-spindle organizing gamma-tubulin ring associated